MDFKVADRNGLDVPAWDNLARNGSFFHTVPWADICVDGAASNARAVFLCGYEKDKLVAGMPAVITRKFGLETFYSMPDGTYGSPIYDSDDIHTCRKGFLTHLAMYLREQNFSRVMLVDFDGNLTDWHEYKMNRTQHFTHLVNLENTEAYHPNKKIESHLRTGNKRESEIVQVRNLSQIEAFYHLYHLTEKRHGHKKTQRRKAFFDILLNYLGDSDKLYWIALMAEGVMVGSQINFIHGDKLFNWLTVSDYEKRQYKPNQLLMYDAICRAVERGLRIVNLGASPTEAYGLIDYKERWQGKKVEYSILHAQSWLRRLLGR